MIQGANLIKRLDVSNLFAPHKFQIRRFYCKLHKQIGDTWNNVIKMCLFIYLFLLLFTRKISTLTNWLLKKDYDVQEMWSNIDDVIVKTLVAAHPILKHSYHACFPAHDFTYACFELLGFDILLDYRLKPYLLEVLYFRVCISAIFCLLHHSSSHVIYGFFVFVVKLK